MLNITPLTLNRILFVCVFLGALNFIDSHAGINDNRYSRSNNSFVQSVPFESTSSTSSVSYSSDFPNNQSHSLNDNNFAPFSSPQGAPAPSAQTFAGFDDDFGDEEIGVIPVGDAVWLLIILSLGYVVAILRKYK